MAIRAGLGLAITYVLGGVVQSAPQLFLVRGITGLISGFVPASMALVSSTLPEEKMGWGMGLMQTAVASGSILGPLLGGYLSVFFCGLGQFVRRDGISHFSCAGSSFFQGKSPGKDVFIL